MNKVNKSLHLPVSKEAPTVQSLKAAGFRVTVLHFRRVKHRITIPGLPCAFESSSDLPLFEIQRLNRQKDILAKGGYTTARVSIPGSSQYVIGEAYCHEEHDVYCKATGIKKALYDAVAKMQKNGMISQECSPETCTCSPSS